MKEAHKEPGHGDAVERTITEAELAAAVFNRAVKKNKHRFKFSRPF